MNIEELLAEPPPIPETLAQWYAAHASIRRLWAFEDQVALTVVLALEPTSDGDDALPVWLANNRSWARDLSSLTKREVHIRLVSSGALEVVDIEPNATMIEEISWRESWLSQ